MFWLLLKLQPLTGFYPSITCVYADNDISVVFDLTLLSSESLGGSGLHSACVEATSLLSAFLCLAILKPEVENS